MEPAGGLLLELARREGGGRLAFDLLLLHGGDDEGGALQGGHDLGGAFGIADLRLLPVDLDEFRLEGGRIRPFEQGGEVPVFLGDECPDLRLPVADDPDGDGLDPTGGKAPLHLVPEEGADLVADETVEDPPGLLRLVPVEVEIVGVGDRVEDGLAGEVVEEDAPDHFFLADLLGDVPGDGLAFAVRVRGEEDLLRSGRRLLEFGDHLLLAVHDQIGGFESLFGIDPEVVFREVLDVTDGGPDIILRAEVFADGFHLGG